MEVEVFFCFFCECGGWKEREQAGEEGRDRGEEGKNRPRAARPLPVPGTLIDLTIHKQQRKTSS